MSNQIEHQLAHPESSLATRRSSLTAIAMARSAFGRTLRAGGYNTYRLDAYKVGTGSDEGGGQSMEGWLMEIETDLMGEA